MFVRAAAASEQSRPWNSPDLNPVHHGGLPHPRRDGQTRNIHAASEHQSRDADEPAADAEVGRDDSCTVDDAMASGTNKTGTGSLHLGRWPLRACGRKVTDSIAYAKSVEIILGKCKTGG